MAASIVTFSPRFCGPPSLMRAPGAARPVEARQGQVIARFVNELQPLGDEGRHARAPV
jgi:hypothetical protein